METPSNDDTNSSPSSSEDVKADVTATTPPTKETLAEGFAEAVSKGLSGVTDSQPKTTPQAKTEQVEEEETEEKEEEKVEAKVEEKTEEKPSEEEQDEKGPVPYERFYEVNEKFKALESRVKEQEDYVAAQNSLNDFCARNEIGVEEFQYWLQVAAAAKQNPQQALEMLKPQLQQMKGFVGEELSDDLKAAVASGEISEAMAKRLAAAENKTQFTTKQVKLTQEQMQQQRQQAYVSSLHSSFNNWLKTKQSAMPDFVPKKSESDPDGMFEFFVNKLNTEGQKAGINSPESLVAFAEKVLSSINKSFETFRPKVNGTKHVRSNQSTSNVRGEPKTMAEAIEMGLAGRQPILSGRK